MRCRRISFLSSWQALAVYHLMICMLNETSAATVRYQGTSKSCIILRFRSESTLTEQPWCNWRHLSRVSVAWPSPILAARLGSETVDEDGCSGSNDCRKRGMRLLSRCQYRARESAACPCREDLFPGSSTDFRWHRSAPLPHPER